MLVLPSPDDAEVISITGADPDNRTTRVSSAERSSEIWRRADAASPAAPATTSGIAPRSGISADATFRSSARSTLGQAKRSATDNTSPTSNPINPAPIAVIRLLSSIGATGTMPRTATDTRPGNEAPDSTRT